LAVTRERRPDVMVQVNVTMRRDTPYSYPIKSSEWELVESKLQRHSVRYGCCPYITLEFEMLLRRRPTFASHLFVAPSVILCLVTPTVFLLPPASFEKLTLGKSAVKCLFV